MNYEIKLSEKDDLGVASGQHGDFEYRAQTEKGRLTMLSVEDRYFGAHKRNEKAFAEFKEHLSEEPALKDRKACLVKEGHIFIDFGESGPEEGDAPSIIGEVADLMAKYRAVDYSKYAPAPCFRLPSRGYLSRADSGSPAIGRRGRAATTRIAARGECYEPLTVFMC